MEGKKLLIIIVSFMITISSACYASESFQFGGVSGIKPILYYDGFHPKGFLYDISNIVLKNSGIKSEIALYPFKRMDFYLKSGDLDGTISIFYKKERGDYLIYVKTPVLVSRTLIFTRKDKKFTFNSVKDLYGRKIGIVAGWSIANSEFNKALKENLFKTEETTLYENSIKKLLWKRIDCFVATEQLTWLYLNNMGVAEEITSLKTVLAENRTHFAISRFSKKLKSPENTAKKINSSLKTIISDGTYAKLLKHYRLVSLK